MPCAGRQTHDIEPMRNMCFATANLVAPTATDRAAHEAPTYLLELGRLAGGRAHLAKGPQGPLVLFPGNAEQAQRGSLGLQGRHHLSKSVREREITGLFARQLSDNNHFRGRGSRGSTSLCALPCLACLASRGCFLLFCIPPPKLGSSIHDRGVFCNVQIDIAKPRCRHPTATRHVRHAMTALLLLSKVEGARSHAA